MQNQKIKILQFFNCNLENLIFVTWATSDGRAACQCLKNMTVSGLEKKKTMIIRNTKPAQEMYISIIVRIIILYLWKLKKDSVLIS
jgi:hypothetical protein